MKTRHPGFLLLLLVSLGMAGAAAEEALMEIVATGVGVDALSAEKQALTAAVQQAVGVQIDAKTVVNNEQVIEQRILSLSQGFVKTYSPVRPVSKRSDGLFQATIRASVDTARLKGALRSANVLSGQLDGRALWAESTTKSGNLNDSLAFLQAKIPEYCQQLVRIGLYDKDGKPTQSRQPAQVVEAAGSMRMTWYAQLSLDRDLYFNDFAPALIRCYKNITQSQGVKAELHAMGNHSVQPATPDRPQPYDKTAGFRDPSIPFPYEFALYSSTAPLMTPPEGQPDVIIATRMPKAGNLMECIKFPRKDCHNVLEWEAGGSFVIAIELLSEDGQLVAKGYTDIQPLFGLCSLERRIRGRAGGELWQRQSYYRSDCVLNNISPFAYTEMISFDHLEARDPFYHLEVEVSKDAVKEISRMECRVEIPDIRLKIVPARP